MFIDGDTLIWVTSEGSIGGGGGIICAERTSPVDWKNSPLSNQFIKFAGAGKEIAILADNQILLLARDNMHLINFTLIIYKNGNSLNQTSLSWGVWKEDRGEINFSVY